MSSETLRKTPKHKLRFAGLLGALRRNEDGVTAVEFGMIAFPFLVLIVAILETALVHMTSLDLENAVKSASRQIRTGQAQGVALSAAGFKSLVCAKTAMISSCTTTPNLIIDVRTYDDFNTVSTDSSELYDEKGNFTDSQSFSPGSGSKVVVVRAYYKMSLLAQFPVIGLANAGPNHRMLSAISVFRNEPFS